MDKNQKWYNNHVFPSNRSVIVAKKELYQHTILLNLLTLTFLLLLQLHCLAEVSFSGSPQQPSSALSLWYGFPATDWMRQALPLGNGRLGTMVFGGVSQDHIQFNDATLWTGDPNNFGSYQNFGDLYLSFNGLTSVSNYTRWLDMQQGVQYVKYTVGSTTYTRTYFCSYPDNVAVISLTSTGSANLNFSVSLADAHNGTVTASGNRITATGACGILHYESQVSVINTGGSVSTSGSTINVSNADSVTIILGAATDYSATTSSYTSGISVSGLDANVTNTVNAAAAKSVSTLLSNHITDYQSLFNRVLINLNSTTPAIPTDQLLSNYENGNIDTAMEVLLFQYGRYLTISGSRNTLPTNLQGIWNNSNSPAWSSDYHTDINVQMNYFATDIVNLAECTTPYISWIYNEAVVQPQWTWIGTNMLGNGGWTVMTQNNIFGNSNWGNMYSENAWLCNGLWRHYLFTMNSSYLSNTAYPVMKSAATFWLNRLVTDSDGRLVAPQGWSPEHGPTQNGVAFDQQLIYDLFANTIAASQTLNIDSAFRSSLQTAINKLDNGMHIGDCGQLQEWKFSDDDPADTHRHQSYAVCLYPGTELQPFTSPSLAQAIQVSLDHRGDGGDGGSGYGWDHAWKTSLRARLYDGNHAYNMIKGMIQQDIATNLFDIYGYWVFQIDANYGYVAGVSEMLLQSHAGYIHLLPALPSSWPSGSVTGLIAQGNFTVSETWSQGGLRSATIKSNAGGMCSLKSPQFAKSGTFTVTAGGSSVGYTLQDDVISFATSSGSTYTVTVNSPAADFALSALPASLTTSSSQTSASTTIAINPRNGFSSAVSLSLANLPSGVTGLFSSPSTTSSSQLTLTSSSSAANGPATINIIATSGSFMHVLPVSLYITNGQIASGTYRIVNIGQYDSGTDNSTSGSALALDCPNGSSAGAGVDQQPYTGTNQQWRITSLGNGLYSIINVGSNLALTGATPNAQIVLQSDTGAANQKWSFTRSGNQYIIVNSANSQVVDNSAANKWAGNPTYLWTNNAAANQKWSIIPILTITSLSPASVAVNSGDFTLTINGSGFTPSTKVTIGGLSSTVTYISDTQITVPISNSTINVVKTITVDVSNPNGQTASTPIYVIKLPAPSITSLNPTTTPGAATFTLTVNGTNFVNGSIIKWNGTNITTTYVSPTQLTASINKFYTTLAGYPGTATVSVLNPDGGRSAGANITITAPIIVPTITSLSPSSIKGATTFMLTVNGSNFANGSIIKWNGTNMTTTYVSTTQLTASINKYYTTLSSYPGTATISILNPDGRRSAGSTITITQPIILPAITSLSPSSVKGATTFTITVNGTGFQSGAVIKWNGTNMTTTYVSATQLTAVINKYFDTLASYPGSATVSVLNPDSDRSAGVSLSITAP